jgi:hypothetical protein
MTVAQGASIAIVWLLAFAFGASIPRAGIPMVLAAGLWMALVVFQ